MMKQLTASVTAQDARFADLSTKTNSGGGSSRAGQNTDNKKSANRLARVHVLKEGSISQVRQLLRANGQ